MMADHAQITDWVGYIRDCIHAPAEHPELGTEAWTIESALSKLSADLTETPYGARLADAALQLLERGTTDEAKRVLLVSFDAAPRAAPRLAAVIDRWQGDDESAGILIRRALEANATDPVLVEAIHRFVREDRNRARIAALAAASLNTDVVLRYAAAFTSEADPDGRQLLLLALRSESRLPELLAVLEGGGPDYVRRLAGAASAAPVSEELRQRIESHLRSVEK